MRLGSVQGTRESGGAGLQSEGVKLAWDSSHLPGEKEVGPFCSNKPNGGGELSYGRTARHQRTGAGHLRVTGRLLGKDSRMDLSGVDRRSSVSFNDKGGQDSSATSGLTGV